MEKVIHSDENIMLGKEIIRGTRIPAALIKRKYSEGMSMDEFKEAYPQLTMEDILSTVLYG